MTLTARLSEYKTALPSRLSTARAEWSERAGIILTLEDGAGCFGRGEAAPLPGYSDQALDACREALVTLDAERLEALTPEALLAGELSATLPETTPPEARFAIESALLELFARRRGQPLHRLLRSFLAEPGPLAPIELSALIGSELESWEPDTRQALDAGYKGVKLKVGKPAQLTKELAELARLEPLLTGATLRLDANGSLTRDALPEFSRLSLEFLEEPLPLGVSLEALPGVPLALDESLRAIERTPSLLDSPGVVAWVIKLGPLGGFSRVFALREAARQRGIELVPSHTLESAIGFAGAAELALALGPGRFPAGLAPYANLANIAALTPPRLVPHAAVGLGV